MSNRSLAIFQVLLIAVSSIGVWHFTSKDSDDKSLGDGTKVVDSNGVEHYFETTPSRIAITNTYAATVMKMLDINSSVITGVSGDFYDDKIWPELSEKPLVQQSAHSEIDFEALLDTRPEIYLVFATNGMVDTGPIRELLEPIGVKVLALDFYKYDHLRTEIGVLATIFGKEDRAQMLFDEFDEIESMVSDKLTGLSPEEIPNVVMEHHASLTRDPVVLTGTSQWTDLIGKAGGFNVFADLPGHTTHVDMEAILETNPEVIMFDGITFDIGYNSFDDDDSCGSHMEHISGRPGFDNMNAVQEDRMFIMSGEFAGPMMIHGLPTLAKLLHPDLFEDVNANSYLDDYFTKYHGIERIGKFVCQSSEV